MVAMSNGILIFILSLAIQTINFAFGNTAPISLTKTNDSIIISIKTASPSARLLITEPTSTTASNIKGNKKTVVTPSQPNIPWGTTEKIGDHLYRTFVANDDRMGTPDEIVAALNKYRKDNGQAPLQKYDKLCGFAQKRADEQQAAGSLDSHKGFEEYMNDENHWKELDVTAVGENASYGYVLSGTHLIEWVFDSDEEHRGNQLNPSWSLVCPAVSGETVDIIFGKK